jgi:hypothetical protein
MFTVYTVTVGGGGSLGFGASAKLATRREVNDFRRKIFNGPSGTTSMVYDSNGKFVVAGWHKTT